MANPVLTAYDYTAPTWVDDENNWRAEDVHFIRNRSVLKFRDEDTATNWFSGQGFNTTGALMFVSGDADTDITNGIGTDPYFGGYFSSGGTPVIRRLLAAKYLRTPTDTVDNVTLRHSVPSSGGVTLSSDGSVKAESTFKVGSRVTVSAGVVTLNDASTGTGTLQLTAGVLTSNTSFSCTGITATGTVSTGALTATGLIVSSGGALVTGNSTVTGTLTVTSTISATTSVTSPIISTGSSAGNPRLTTTGLSALGTASVNLVTEGTAVNVISPGAPFMFQNETTETLTRVAGVNVSTSDAPTTGGLTYPEGTIWLKVSA
jgi:hypothetical protein